MIGERTEVNDTRTKLVCGSCECDISTCSICSTYFEEDSYVRCVELEDIIEGKNYKEFLHLCNKCKDKKHNIEKQEGEE